MSSIFISHSSLDKSFVRKLAADLRVYGHNVWVDEGEINIGDSLIKKIREGIDSVDYVIAVLSKSSINSEWVLKEIEIASIREINEKRVIVLPILIEKVTLPGFLEGKKYCNFSKQDSYENNLNDLLNSFKDNNPIKKHDKNELEKVIAELERAKDQIMKKENFIQKISEYNFKKKSERLKKAIIKENKSNPEFAPINNVYAFELDGVPLTLGYLLFCIDKALLKGGHIIEIELTLENKWGEVYSMIEAYIDMIKLSK